MPRAARVGAPRAWTAADVGRPMRRWAPKEKIWYDAMITEYEHGNTYVLQEWPVGQPSLARSGSKKPRDLNAMLLRNELEFARARMAWVEVARAWNVPKEIACEIWRMIL